MVADSANGLMIRSHLGTMMPIIFCTFNNYKRHGPVDLTWETGFNQPAS